MEQLVTDPAPAVTAETGAVPVFVDLSGRRGRHVTVIGFVASLLMIAFVVAVVAAVVVHDPVPGGRLPHAVAWSHVSRVARGA